MHCLYTRTGGDQLGAGENQLGAGGVQLDIVGSIGRFFILEQSKNRWQKYIPSFSGGSLCLHFKVSFDLQRCVFCHLHVAIPFSITFFLLLLFSVSYGSDRYHRGVLLAIRLSWSRFISYDTCCFCLSSVLEFL